jgi:DNA polymerase-3 subunit gamma/tau
VSYQVLARKWRPRTFAGLVGQEHVVRPLVNALDHGRLHHAFLFTGTRGVGKTTIARILAKSLNCETGVTSRPCGRCSACTEVDEGRFVDLIEVDAASRTKVDDTRELLDNVPYAPTRGRYKVYLIDEVHMLSGHSFNALLKTLEEPPPHVKFLLATTDPQKLPATVLSRCLQFNLKRLEPAQIEAQLRKILDAEKVAYDAPSLVLLARAADGSLRDGLSLLDQAIAYGGGKVTEAEVRAMLGTIDQDVVDRALRALAGNDARALLGVVADVAAHGTGTPGLLDELLGALHRIALIQVDPALAREGEDLGAHAARLAPEDVQLYYQIGLMGRRDLAYAPDPRTGVEMTLLRMLAFRPAAAAAETPTTPAAAPRAKATASAAPAATAATPAPKPQPAPAAAPPAAAAVPAVPPQSRSAPTAGRWSEVVTALGINGFLRELVSHTALESETEGTLNLVLHESFAKLHNKDREAELKRALEQYYGRALKLNVRIGQPPAETPAQEKTRERDERQEAAERAIQTDPTVGALVEKFNARVVPGTIRPKT